MRKTTTICDMCCDTMKSTFMQVDDIDLCSRCCKHVVYQYIELQSNAGKGLRSQCSECNGTGKISVRDNEATNAQASCGENRTQYKTVWCDKCINRRRE